MKHRHKIALRRRRKVRHPDGPFRRDAKGRLLRGGGDPFESGAAGRALIQLFGRRRPR